MDLEGEIFEFQELEAQNKGEKVNKTICFKGSGGLYQRQESYVHDCNTVRWIVQYKTIINFTMYWYLLFVGNVDKSRLLTITIEINRIVRCYS